MFIKCLSVVSLLNCDINIHICVDRSVSFADARSIPIKCLLRLGIDINVEILIWDGSVFFDDAQPICINGYVFFADARSTPI